MNTLPIDIGSDELYIIDGTFEAGANTAQKKKFYVLFKFYFDDRSWMIEKKLIN